MNIIFTTLLDLLIALFPTAYQSQFLGLLELIAMVLTLWVIWLVFGQWVYKIFKGKK